MEFKSFMEALKGKQHKIDKNKNGEVDAHDFKLLRKEETEELEEATVKTQKYEGGKVMTVHHGASHSYPLHPEHQEAIRNLKHGEKTSFKDETGAKVNVHRDVQDVHFTSNKTSTKTTVPYSHFSEEVEIEEGNGYDDNRHGFRKPPREDDEYHVPDPVRKPQAPVAPVPARKYIRGTPENKALKASRKPINGMPTNEEVDLEEKVSISYKVPTDNYNFGAKPGDKTRFNKSPNITRKMQLHRDVTAKAVKSIRAQGGNPANHPDIKINREEVEEIEERNKQNALMRKNMDASRGARYKLNNPVPDASPEQKTAQAHNKAIGRALRSEAHMTTTKDKSGKLISFKYEGDWKKSTEKKEGSGKAANLAGQGMQAFRARARKVNMGEEVEHVEESKGMVLHQRRGNALNSDADRLAKRDKPNDFGNSRHLPQGKDLLKVRMKADQGKHTRPNLPEEVEHVEEGIVDFVKQKYHGFQTNRHLDKVSQADKKGDTAAANTAHAAALKHRDLEQAARYRRTGSTMSKNSVQGYAQDSKNYHALKAKGLVKTEEVEHIHELNDNLHPAGAALLKHIKPQHHNLYKPHLAKDTFNGSYKDRTDVLNAAKKAGHLEEAKDEQEYGYEGDMALNQLATLTRCAEMIKEMLKPDTDMPEWVQSKITLATDYIQTAADYMHSEMNEGKSVDIDKVNVAGDVPHEEKFETFKKTKRVKESFDDEGNLISNKISYKDFITEIKLADLPSRKIQGRSYGANYSDPEGADDYDDKKPIKPAAEKRGRGRPAGAKSGARKITGTSKLINK